MDVKELRHQPKNSASLLLVGKFNMITVQKNVLRLLDAQPFNQSYMQWMQRVVSSDFTDRNNGRKDGPIMFPCSDGVPIVNICFRRRMCAEIPNQALFSTKTMTIDNRECNWRSSKAYFSITNANPSIIYNGPLMQSQNYSRNLLTQDVEGGPANSIRRWWFPLGLFFKCAG